MTDIVNAEIRSKMMASIHGKDTKPELIVRRFLHSQGLRFRLHVRTLPGRPDLVLPRHRVALFVHGCFWHRHAGCRFAYSPKSNAIKWQAKFMGNMERDARNRADLLRQGWRVLIVWECVLNKPDCDDTLGEVAKSIVSGQDIFREWPPAS